MTPLLDLRKAVEKDLRSAKKAKKFKQYHSRYLEGVINTLHLVRTAIDVCIDKEDR